MYCEVYSEEEFTNILQNKERTGIYIDYPTESFPKLEGAKHLQQLWIPQNKLTKIPELVTLTNLLELDFSENKLTTLPELKNLPNLRELNFCENQLTTLPDFVPLINLRRLWVYENKLTSLPQLNTAKLKRIEVDHNKLTAIPERIKTISYKNTLKQTYPKWIDYGMLVETMYVYEG